MAKFTDYEIASELLKIYRKHFHGYPSTRGNAYEIMHAAAEALTKPKSEQELCNALQSQSHAIDAAGWSGAAVLMRDAAKRISWHLQHGVEMPGATIPLTKENLVKELRRYAKATTFDMYDYTSDLLNQAAQIVQESIDKPVTDSEVSESIKMSHVPDILHEISSYASRAQIAFLEGNNLDAHDFVFKANMRLQSVAALLRVGAVDG